MTEQLFRIEFQHEGDDPEWEDHGKTYTTFQGVRREAQKLSDHFLKTRSRPSWVRAILFTRAAGDTNSVAYRKANHAAHAKHWEVNARGATVPRSERRISLDLNSWEGNTT